VSQMAVAGRADARATAAYVAPFAAYVALLGLERLLPFSPALLYPLRLGIVLAVTLVFSRDVVDLRPARPISSVLAGIAVFLIWIGPDVLWPDYRRHWLFANSLVGTAASSLPEALRSDPVFLSFRVAGSVLFVPILEELFWRGWLLRWLVSPNFTKVPLGKTTPLAFWIVALLFASEHGPYWDVGLLAGIAYNWWIMRTRSLADCILAHAVTNACLAAYVLRAGKWKYWL